MSDFSIYKKLEIARIASNTEIANAIQVVGQGHQETYQAFIANSSAAVAETVFTRVPYAGNMVAAHFTNQKAAVANATDYAVVTVSKRTGAGSAVVMATANLSNVAVSAFVPIALTVANVANATVAAGDFVTFTTANTGNGIANNGTATIDIIVEDIA
jgi:hypothetical protein